MLADDVEELMDLVGGMDRDRQLSGVRLARRCPQQRRRAGLDLARHQYAAQPVVVGAGAPFDEVERQR